MVAFLDCEQEDLGPGIRNDRANYFYYSIKVTYLLT
jgi:hypothetical protein